MKYTFKIKNIISLICVCAILFSGILPSYSLGIQSETNKSILVWDGTEATEFAGGIGTQDAPYLISNGGQLYHMLSQHNNNKGKYFKLTNDIYLNDVTNPNWKTNNPNEWIEHSESGVAPGNFSGKFDGDGHTVYGIYYDDTKTHSKSALIPRVWSSETYSVEIKDVGVENSYINGQIAAGIVATFSGQQTEASLGTVSQCYAGEDVVVKAVSNVQGGVIGNIDKNYFNITDCYFIGDFEGTVNADRVGGIIGFISVSNPKTVNISNSYAITPDNDTVISLTWPGSQCMFSNVYGTKFWDSATNNSPLVKILTAEQMKGENAKTYMNGLSFGAVWKVGENDGYPTLCVFDGTNGDSDSEGGNGNDSFEGTISPADVWDGTEATEFAGGTGIAEDPYLIANGGQLYHMLSQHNNNKGKYFKLTNDIYLNDVTNPNWKTNNPNEWIEHSESGVSPGNFSGKFDGDGHTVYGIYYDDTKTHSKSALIPRVWSSETYSVEIKNVGVENSYINGNIAAGIVATFSGQQTEAALGTVSQCYTGEDVVVKAISNVQGGIIGNIDKNYFNITDCYFTGDFEGTVTTDRVGGIIGFISVSNPTTVNISNSYAITPDNDTVISLTWPGSQCMFSNVYGTKFWDSATNNSPLVKILTAEQMQGDGAEIYMNGLDYDNVWLSQKGKTPVLRIFVDFSAGGDDDISKLFAGGTGAEQDPYLIKTAEQLLNMRSLISRQSIGKYFKLCNDINVNDVSKEDWKTDSPVIWETDPYNLFRGHFNGDGHIIRGLYLYKKNALVGGLFSRLGKDSTVINVGIEDSYIEGKQVAAIAGGVAGTNVTIKNCYADETVEISGSVNCGGLVAELRADYFTLTNCYFTGKLTGGTTNTPKAGLLGDVDGVSVNYTVTLSNCYVATTDNDYTLVPISKATNMRCINLYGTKEQIFANDATDVSYTILGDFFVTTREEMLGEKAKKSMPQLDYGAVFVTKEGETPKLRIFTGDTVQISGEKGKVWSGNIATSYDGGKGTENDPYRIATAEQLALLVSTSTYEPLITEGKYYVLTEDIIINDTSENEWYKKDTVKPWFYDLNYRSIGFLGNLNGKGHTVSGICYPVRLEWRSFGLFGALGGSAVVENVEVSNMYSENAHWIGGISGFISRLASTEKPVTIRQCISASTNELNGGCVGGILAHACNAVIITDCLSQAKVSHLQSRGTILGMADTDKEVIVKNCLSLDVGRAKMLWYAGTGNKKIPVMKNLYSTYGCMGAETVYLSDILGEDAKKVLNGLDFENIWKTVGGGTPVPKEFADNRHSIPKKKVTITFKTFGGTELGPISGYIGDMINWPDESEIVRGKDKFIGWYMEEDMLREYPYDVFPEYDMELYANWEEVIWNGKIADSFDGGRGTKTEPYLISNGGQLYRMLDLGHNSNNSYFKITKDIYLNDVSNPNWKSQNPNCWYELDSTETYGAFSGCLDGDGHKIYGIYYPDNQNRLYAGLIPKLLVKQNRNVEIKNLGVEESYITAKKASGLVAFIYGESSSSSNVKISKCYVDDSVTVGGSQHQGGMIAFLNYPKIKISNCYSIASFKSVLDSTKDWQGGLVGFAYGSTAEEFKKNAVTENCYAVTPNNIPVTSIAWNYTSSKFSNVYGNTKNEFNLNNFPAIKVLTLQQMQGSNAYKYMKELNFDTVWQISDDGGYPTLRIFGRNGQYDTNQDGNVNIIDLVYYKKCLSDIYKYEVEDFDINSDFSADGLDVAIIKKNLIGAEIDLVEQIPPRELSDTIEGTLGTYKLVWNDEFNEEGIDYNKWCYGYEFLDNHENMLLLTEQEDSSIITASEGLLKMNARRYVSKSDPTIEYATNRSFGTRETMNFKYGYVEMRAKVPMKQGSFSAFWSIGKPALVQKKSNHYYVEMDFFECFSSPFQIWPNFHKWYDDGGHSNFDKTVSDRLGTSIGNSVYRHFNFSNYETLPFEYHTYAVEWTKECVKTFVDGECYASLDITMPYDADWEYSNTSNTSVPLNPLWRNDMSGYHDYIYLLLQNLIYTSDSSPTGNKVNNDSQFPYEYSVDYVRLYQDPQNKDNGLYYKNEKGETVNYYAD